MGCNRHCSSYFTGLILCFCSMVFLASCPGNGGATYSDGATYEAGGTGSHSGASGSPNSNTLSATDITSLASAGDTGKLIKLLTAGQDSGKTTPVDIPVSDMGLPAGTTGSVTITMTVNGTTRTYNASIEDDRVHFDIPAVPSNSEVSVRMDVRDTDGKLLLTGSTSKTVSGTEDALAVTLSDKVPVPVTVNCNALFFGFTIPVGATTRTEVVESPSGSFSESLGTNITLLNGYAVTTDFKVVSFPATSVTVTENTSVTLLRNSFDVCSVADRLNFRIYTDETYTPEYDTLYTEQYIINGAIAKGYLTIVDAHIQVTSNIADPNAWRDLGPTDMLGVTNDCRLRYKLKAGGITSGEFFSPSVMAQMHA